MSAIDPKDLPDKYRKQIENKLSTGKKRAKENETPRGMDAPAKIYTAESTMNKWERLYGALLETLKKDGAIIDYFFEPLNLRLGKNCFYKPDFLVIRADERMEIHEVKGFWRDDALVKIRTAAEIHHYFKFKSVTKKDGAWKFREFN